MTVGSVESGATSPHPGANASTEPESAPKHPAPRVLARIMALGLVVLTLAVGTLVPTIHETSVTSISADVRHETVVAAQERGLAPLHPLILDASVEAGPASAATELGHRATVTFTMLGVPGPTHVKLFVDVGAHWGGTPDRGAAELAIWSLLTPMLVLGGPWLLWRVRRRRADR